MCLKSTRWLKDFINLFKLRRKLFQVYNSVLKGQCRPSTSISNSILRLQNALAHENKVIDALVDSTQKVKVLKEKLKNVTIKLGKMNEERILVKGYNFELNQCLFRIAKNKNALYTDYILDLIHAKSNHIFSKFNDILNVMSSMATMQQGGDKEVNEEEVLKVNLNNPYQTVKSSKMENVEKIVLEKETMEDRFKNL